MDKQASAPVDLDKHDAAEEAMTTGKWNGVYLSAAYLAACDLLRDDHAAMVAELRAARARIDELEIIARAVSDASPYESLSTIKVTLAGDRRLYLRSAAHVVLNMPKED